MVLLRSVLLQYNSNNGPIFDNRIFVVNSDGSDFHEIDDGVSKTLDSPVWSPDGNEIAFLSGKTIYIVNADGSNLRHFTYATAQDNRQNCSVGIPPADGPNAYGLSWEPDGKRLALQVYFCGHAQYLTYLVNSDGSDFHIAFKFWDYLAWSPIQNRLMTSSGWTSFFVVQDVDNNGMVKITRNVPTPSATASQHDDYTGSNSCSGGSGAWSHDGQWFACSSSAVDIVNANGDYQYTLVNGFNWFNAPADLAPISWSPDGQQLALIKMDPDYQEVLYAINSDGSNLRPLAAGSLKLVVMWQPPVK
jgi:Tol biopolymer transport system component